MKQIPIKVIISIIFISIIATPLFSADSKGNRGSNNVSIGTSLGLLSWANVTNPISIAMPGEDWTFGLEYGSKSISTDSTSSGIKSTGSFNITDTGVFARYYYGNSFNSILALNSMSSEMSVTSTNASTGGSATGKLSTSAMRFTAGIGNEWTMDWGLVIGADWLTGSALLSQSVSASVSESSGTIDTSDTTKSMEELGKVINVLSSIPGIVVFRIGFSF